MSRINNTIKTAGNTTTILITKNDDTSYLKEVIIDTEDLPLLGKLHITPNGYVWSNGRNICHTIMNHISNMSTVIDHINGNRLDNSINNLREISVQGNAQNRTNRKHKLPLYIYNHRNKYPVRITTDKARAYGSFSTIEEALAKRDEICKQLNINIY